MEIRRSYDRLISTMGFPILVRRHLYIESGPGDPIAAVPLSRASWFIYVPNITQVGQIGMGQRNRKNKNLKRPCDFDTWPFDPKSYKSPEFYQWNVGCKFLDSIIGTGLKSCDRDRQTDRQTRLSVELYVAAKTLKRKQQYHFGWLCKSQYRVRYKCIRRC